MATTSLWRVKGYLSNLVAYVENPDKTIKRATITEADTASESLQGLSDVIAYVERPGATATPERQLVTGINCYHKTARDEMLAVKRRFGKEDGVIAYHGYQSFKPGEVTPELCHEIGKKLAQRVWGDKYQVLVATHMDKEHIHNHFLVNTVSFVDGKKYHRTKADYKHFRDESDKLCKEYGLSIIEQKPREQTTTRHYAEIATERDGKLPWKEIVRLDFEDAISRTISSDVLIRNLKTKGYEVKWGKSLSLKPPGKDRFVRLERHFGERYSNDGIKQRFDENYANPKEMMKAPYRTRKSDKAVIDVLVKGLGKYKTGSAIWNWCHLCLQAKLDGQPRPDEAIFWYLDKLEDQEAEARNRQRSMLVRYDVKTTEDFVRAWDEIQAKITDLTRQRACLYQRIYRSKPGENTLGYRDDIKMINRMLKLRRTEVYDYKQIQAGSLKRPEKQPWELYEEHRRERQER